MAIVVSKKRLRDQAQVSHEHKQLWLSVAKTASGKLPLEVTFYDHKSLWHSTDNSQFHVNNWQLRRYMRNHQFDYYWDYHQFISVVTFRCNCNFWRYIVKHGYHLSNPRCIHLHLNINNIKKKDNNILCRLLHDTGVVYPEITQVTNLGSAKSCRMLI